MKSLLKKLSGKKTYLASAAIMALVVGQELGQVKLTKEQLDALVVLLNAGGIAALRAALKNLPALVVAQKG